jgi:hypothetical protein
MTWSLRDDKSGERCEDRIADKLRLANRRRVEPAETVTIRPASASQVVRDRDDEGQQEPQRSERSPPGADCRQQGHGNSDLRHWQQASQRPGQVSRNAEYDERLS